MNDNISFKKEAILDGTNYRIWYDNIIDAIDKEGLGEYLEKDILAELNTLDQDKEETKRKIKEANINNSKVRYIIKNTINTKIHNDRIGIKTSSEIIAYLKEKYEHDVNNMTQWINKLKTIKAKKEVEIPSVIKKILRIFKNMDDLSTGLEDKKKVKYFLNALPNSYRKKLVLTNDTNVDDLKNKINEDLKMWAYVGDLSNNNEDTDNPMDIDYAWKYNHRKNNNKKNNNNKNNNNKNNKLFSKKGYFYKKGNFNKEPNHCNRFNNKYCEICERNGHSTRECRYNPWNPKGIFNKYYKNDLENHKHEYNDKYHQKGKKATGYINLNDEYNEDVSYDDIKCFTKFMIRKEKKETMNLTNMRNLIIL